MLNSGPAGVPDADDAAVTASRPAGLRLRGSFPPENHFLYGKLSGRSRKADCSLGQVACQDIDSGGAGGIYSAQRQDGVTPVCPANAGIRDQGPLASVTFELDGGAEAAARGHMPRIRVLSVRLRGFAADHPADRIWRKDNGSPAVCPNGNWTRKEAAAGFEKAILVPSKRGIDPADMEPINGLFL